MYLVNHKKSQFFDQVNLPKYNGLFVEKIKQDFKQKMCLKRPVTTC